MTDPRPSISDAALERALASLAPHGADTRLLASVVADAGRHPQQGRWSAMLRALGSKSRRPLVFVTLLLATAMTIGALLAGVGASRPTPSITPVPLAPGNGPITLSGYIPTDSKDAGLVVGMPTCATCPAGTQPSWSRDGTTVAYIAAGGELWTWHEGDASARRLLSCPSANCPAWTPSWSPDGRSLLFVADTRPKVIDTTTLEIREVALRVDGPVVSETSWSATDRIAYLDSNVGTGDWAAWVSASDGSQPMLVARSTAGSGFANIALSPSGDQLVVLEDPSVPGTNPDPFTIRIWLYAVDGSPGRLLYEQPGCCVGLAGFSAPAWSPDGTKIAVVALSTTEGTPSSADVVLLTIDVATGKRTVVVRVPSRSGDASAPAWRPH